MAGNSASLNYVNQPCDRCGSKKRVAKTWKETLKTAAGVSILQVSQVVCTNDECQKSFDEDRAVEVMRVNERKLKKEEQDKVRRDNIARTILERKKAKAIA